MRARSVVWLVMAGVLTLAGPAQAQVQFDQVPGDTAAPPESPAAPTSGPTAGALYDTGPDGRYLLGGTWLFRRDDADVGLRSGFARASSTDSWDPVSVPHVWNATD